MTLDGQYLEAAWSFAPWQSIPATACNYYLGCGSTDNSASAQYNFVKNSVALWIGVNVNDPGILYANTTTPWNGSGVEIFFDLNNTKTGDCGTGDYLDPNTYQWCITYNTNTIVQYRSSNAVTILAASVVTPGAGYTMEIEIPWANLGVSGPPVGGLSGLDINVDFSNTSETARDHAIVAFNGGVNRYDYNPSLWGTISYKACLPAPTATVSPTPVASPNLPGPNPFTPSLPSNNITSFNLLLSHSSGDLAIFDLRSTPVRKISFAAGAKVSWDGKNDSGQVVQGGVFVYLLSVDGHVHKGSITVLK